MSREEMNKHTPLVQQAMGLHNASINEMRKARVLEIRARFGKHERDTANPGITASVLCENVIHLLNHIKKHKKDMSAFIKLKHFLTKRRKYLRYLKHKDFQAYCFIVKYYGINDIEDANAKSFKRMLRI
jgi:small subunit ribosomal protein S15